MNIGIIIALLLLLAIGVMASRKRSRSLAAQAPGTPQKEGMEPTHAIFYHEDDYRQVELVPAENLKELIRQVENVQDFAEKHQEGAGYTDMMLREDSGLKLKDRAISPGELDELLSALPMKRFSQVSTGIRPGEVISRNTLGYGENYNGIFFDFEPEAVTGIWIVGHPPVESEKLVEALHTLGNKWNLLLMDWNALQFIDLKNREQLEKYMLS